MRRSDAWLADAERIRSLTAMRAIISMLLAGVCVVAAATENLKIEFTGVVGSGTDVMLALSAPANRTSRWVKVGGSFEGHTVVAYDPKTQIVLLKNKSSEFGVRLKDAKVTDGTTAEPTPMTATRLSTESAREIYRNLQRISAAADMHYEQRGAQTATLDQLVGSNGYIKRIDAIAGEDYTALKLSRTDRVLSVTAASGERVSFAADPKFAAESSFHQVRPGDTGSGIAKAYGTSMRQLMELNRSIDFSRLVIGQLVRTK